VYILKAKEYLLVSLKWDDLDLMSQETFQSLPEVTVFLAYGFDFYTLRPSSEWWDRRNVVVYISAQTWH
jgi:hypothetical protein